MRRTATSPFVALRRLFSPSTSWLVCVAVGVIAVGSAHLPAAQSRAAVIQRSVAVTYGNVPLRFVANHSQIIAAPTAVNDSYTTPFDTALSVDAPGILSNDSSNGGGAMEVSSVVPPTTGTLTIDSNGSFTFTPATGFVGTVTFDYTASNTTGESATATVTITVTEAVAPPTDLIVTSNTGSRITVTWRAPATGPTPTGYVLEGGVTPGGVLASLPTNSTATTYTFSAPTGAFYIRVHSLATELQSVASNEVRLFVNVPAPPSAPANLLGLVNGSSLSLAWTNTAGGGAPTTLVLDVTGSLNLSVGLPVSASFSFPNVPAGTYTLSLRAANALGVSGSSNSVTLTFPGPCSGVPGPVTNFVLSNTGPIIRASWELPVSGPAPTSYRAIVTDALNADVPLNARSISGGVSPGSYTVSIAAVNACGSGPATPPQTVTIP
jgi:hypothetical protein